MIFRVLVLGITVLLCSNCTNKSISVSLPNDVPQLSFAVEDLKQVLNDKGIVTDISTDKKFADISFLIQPENYYIKPEGFKITVTNNKIQVLASDAAGAMYGGLELAEQIELYGVDGVKEMAQDPYMKMRGTKFNIPLDVRTPSYSDACDAAQKNMAEMWNYDFWKEYIDNMARYRYNFISLWSLHPFPSMVKVPGYEDVALNDVHRSTIQWKENYHLCGVDYDMPEIVDNYEVIKELTIDEKIKFWKKVMAYAKQRNVTFYVITWNIFVDGTNGKYGITESVKNKTTIDYFKESVKAMLLTYPDLGGIGLTAGENMPGVPLDDREDWVFKTYGRGILEAADEMPNRQFTFIHRQHQADPSDIEERFQPLIQKPNVDFIYSFKYAKAHVMSAIKQPYHDEFVKNIGDLKTIWTLRNDDNYYFRWGAPNFVREFIKNIPYEVTQGMYYGSDQWIWGREFTMKDVEGQRQLEVVKHWYHWLMWGRLSYNPDISNERFVDLLGGKFTGVNAQLLFQAWQEASMVYPVTTGFHWGPVDFTWYIEGCRSRPPETSFNETGFHDVNTFIKLPVHDCSGNMSIPDYGQAIVNGETTDLTTPLGVAQKLHDHSDKAIELLDKMGSNSNSQELTYTMHDIKTMALMGKYYAWKIAGSTNVALYRATKDKKYQNKAIEELTEALDAWKAFTEAATQQNVNPIWTNRVGYVDWVKTTEWVKQDIEIAKQN